jgi:hypothetical protein
VTALADTMRNGVDTEKMFATLDLIKAQPELAKFQFRATNRWLDGAHNRSTIKGFHAAGGEDTTGPPSSTSTPASRRSCSAPTLAPTRPSTCCTRSPHASRRRSCTWRRRARSS